MQGSSDRDVAGRACLMQATLEAIIRLMSIKGHGDSILKEERHRVWDTYHLLRVRLER